MAPLARIVSKLPASTPFVAPEALEREMGRPFSARLGANESMFGVSPLALEAMKRAVETIHLYGDPESLELRTALAQLHNCGIENLIVGSGIDDLLGLIARAYVDEGTPVVTSLGGYPTFNFHVQGFGGFLHFVPYTNFANDLRALAEKAQELRPPLVYLSNPDNPTGSYWTSYDIADFRRNLPIDTVLILDEAYADFAPEVMFFDAADPSLIRLRTFSKGFGMAGARIGYAIAPAEMIATFDKIRHHFGVNRVAQAGALASLADREFIAMVRHGTERGRKEYGALAEELGFKALPSATNFVCFHIGNSARAEAILLRLRSLGVFVRKPSVAPLSECIRVTIGRTEERKIFEAAFRQAVRETA